MSRRFGDPCMHVGVNIIIYRYNFAKMNFIYEMPIPMDKVDL